MDTTQEENTTKETPVEVASPEVGVDDSTPSVCKKRCNPTIIASVIAAVLIIGAISYYVYTNNYSHGSVVAVVNRTKLYQDEFEDSVKLMEQNASQQGIDITDASVTTEIRNQALSVLIDNALILTAAKKSGVTASAEEVQEKYDALITDLGSQEALTAKMVEIGLTEEKLRSNIEERILADKYIEAETDIENVTVSDVEVTEFAKTVTDGGMELPPLDEVRPQIEAEITAQKKQQIVTNLLDTLRSDATIEKKI